MSETPTCPNCGSPLPTDAPGGTCPKCLLGLGLSESARATDAYVSPPSQPFLAPKPEDLASHFPQLEILELLGQGGMGAVYKARQPGLDRLVAVKILPPEVGRTPGFAERFAREARALARLSHPHIVAVYDSGERDGLYYFIMEFVDGTNLREMMQGGHLEPEQALAVVPQICDALQYAHENGVVHRDIKPENVLVDKAGRVKIADFGLAKLATGGEAAEASLALTGTYQVMGTPRYMAPEQLAGSRDVDHRADIYSLGVVFYELLTGELPLGRFDPPSHKVQLDVRLDEVVLRTLENSPDRRYQRASEIRTDLETIGREPRQVSTPPLRSPRRAPPQEKPASIEQIRGWLLGPSIGFIVLACLHATLGVCALVNLTVPGMVRAAWFTILAVSGLSFGLAIVTGLAGFQLKNLRWHMLGTVAAVLSMLPLTPVFLAGLPIGLWALWLLLRQDVRSAFDERARHLRDSRPPNLSLFELAQSADSLRTPGLALIVAGVAVLAVSPGAAILLAEEVIRPYVPWSETEIVVTIILATFIPAALEIVAGVMMRRARAYPLCVIGSVTAMLPLSFAWILTMPLGFWALIVLLRQDVRVLFASGMDVGELRRQARAARPPAKPGDPRDSAFYAAGQLTALLFRFMATRQFVVLLCMIGMASILLPWGMPVEQLADGKGVRYGPPQYGWECLTPSAVALVFLVLMLTVIATGGIRELNAWRPLIVAGFAVPAAALSLGFALIELFVQRLGQTEPIDKIDPQGGHLVAVGAAIGLLICAALQFRSSVSSK